MVVVPHRWLSDYLQDQKVLCDAIAIVSRPILLLAVKKLLHVFPPSSWYWVHNPSHCPCKREALPFNSLPTDVCVSYRIALWSAKFGNCRNASCCLRGSEVWGYNIIPLMRVTQSYLKDPTAWLIEPVACTSIVSNIAAFVVSALVVLGFHTPLVPVYSS